MMHLTLALKWSIAALLAGNAADSASSLGRPEMNPALARGGTFTPASVGMKFGIVGGALGVEMWMLKAHPRSEKVWIVENYALGGVFAGVAVRNWRMGGKP